MKRIFRVDQFQSTPDTSVHDFPSRKCLDRTFRKETIQPLGQFPENSVIPKLRVAYREMTDPSRDETQIRGFDTVADFSAGSRTREVGGWVIFA